MASLEAVVTCCGGRAGGVEVWDLQTGSHLRSFAAANCTGWLLPMPDRHVLAIQRDRPGLQLWCWKTGRLAAKAPLPEAAEAVAVSPDGAYVAVGGKTGAVRLWEVPSGRLVRSWRAHYKAVAALAFSGDGAYLVSGGADAMVCVWDAGEAASAVADAGDELRALAQWSEHSLPVTGVAVSPGRAGRAVTVSLDRTVRVWDLVARAQVACFVLPATLHAVAVAGDESAAYAAGGDGRVFAVDLVAGGVTELAGHDQRCVSLSLSLDGGTLLSCGSDGGCRLWDTGTGQTVRSLGKKWPSMHGGAIVRDPHGLLGVAPPPRVLLPTLQKRPVPAPPLAAALVRVRPPADDPRAAKRRKDAAGRATAVAAPAAGPGAAPAAAASGDGDDEGGDGDAGAGGAGRLQKKVRRLEREVRRWQNKCAALLKIDGATADGE